ncbi:MAG: hypothetical protein KKG84_03125 [Candidatus Omnitrophica bacterium]|nr:hypothetical protein [Candidatus Omnitrophota bacterium]
MNAQIKAKEPFKFYTRMILPELTGLKADNLEQLLKILKEVSPSAIYHHTHRFLQQHQHLAPEPPNDFAYWVTEVLGEYRLGEKLASIDTVEFSTIEALRVNIVSAIEKYLKENPAAGSRTAHRGEEFYFVKSISFIFPTKHTARDRDEFVDELKKVTISSIYFHVFEARLRLGKGNNDFSFWISTSVGDKAAADKISKLDPYAYTLEDLRMKIIALITERTKK